MARPPHRFPRTARRLAPGFLALLTLSISVLLAAPALADDLPPDPNAAGLTPDQRISRLIDRIKYQQAQLQTMEASFVQRKESLVLLEPEESSGRFWYRAPDRVRWDFAAPSDTVVLIREDEMLTWFRNLGTAEQVSIGRQADRVMEYLSASNSLETLQRYFTLQVAFPENPSSPLRLEMDPRYKRVAKRIAGMEIHLDQQGYFPVYLRYEEPDGDITELTFSDVETNHEISDEQFEVELPAEVDVQQIDLSKKKSR